MAAPQPESGWGRRSFSSLFTENTAPSTIIKSASLHKGEPGLIFSKEEMDQLSLPFRFALIGRFHRGRPPLEWLRKDFQTIGLKGDVQVGVLDYRHILIRPVLEEDYIRLWLKHQWFLSGVPMKIHKWTPTFRLTQDPSVIPVWISLENLPIQFFCKRVLFSIASVIGNPLKVDDATATLTRPSVARICLEIDLLKPMPSRIWLGSEGDGFYQTIFYENLPQFCSKCNRLGHDCSYPSQHKDKNQSQKHVDVHPQKHWTPKKKDPASTNTTSPFVFPSMGINVPASPVVNISSPIDENLKRNSTVMNLAEIQADQALNAETGPSASEQNNNVLDVANDGDDQQNANVSKIALETIVIFNDAISPDFGSVDPAIVSPEDSNPLQSSVADMVPISNIRQRILNDVNCSQNLSTDVVAVDGLQIVDAGLKYAAVAHSTISLVPTLSKLSDLLSISPSLVQNDVPQTQHLADLGLDDSHFASALQIIKRAQLAYSSTNTTASLAYQQAHSMDNLASLHEGYGLRFLCSSLPCYSKDDIVFRPHILEEKVVCLEGYTSDSFAPRRLLRPSFESEISEHLIQLRKKKKSQSSVTPPQHAMLTRRKKVVVKVSVNAGDRHQSPGRSILIGLAKVLVPCEFLWEKNGSDVCPKQNQGLERCRKSSRSVRGGFRGGGEESACSERSRRRSSYSHRKASKESCIC